MFDSPQVCQEGKACFFPKYKKTKGASKKAYKIAEQLRNKPKRQGGNETEKKDNMPSNQSHRNVRYL